MKIQKVCFMKTYRSFLRIKAYQHQHAIFIFFGQNVEPIDVLCFQRFFWGRNYNCFFIWILWKGQGHSASCISSEASLNKCLFITNHVLNLQCFYCITHQCLGIGNFKFVNDRDKEKILK